MAEITNKSVFELVLPLVDYTGDMQRSAGIKGYTYNPKFSPNNIRKLVISPDVVKVFYNVNIGKGLSMMKQITSIYPLCATQEGYVPIMAILFKYNLCACIEEIVFITHGVNGNTLMVNDYRLEGLTEGYYNGTNIKERIYNRFARLRDIVVFNGDYREYAAIEENKGRFFFTKLTDSGKANVEFIHKDDWYTSLKNLHAQTYEMDGTNGKLYLYLMQLKEHEEGLKKIENSEKTVKKPSKDDMAAQKVQLERYLGIASCYSRVKKFLDSDGSNSLYKNTGVSLPLPKKLVLYDNEGLKGVSQVSRVQNTDIKNSEVLGANIARLKEENIKLYSDICEFMLRALCAMSDKSPVTVKTMLYCLPDRAVMIPNSLESLNAELNAKTGTSFSGEKVENSFCNMCNYITLLFGRSDSKFYTGDVNKSKEFWVKTMKKYKGGEE